MSVKPSSLALRMRSSIVFSLSGERELWTPWGSARAVPKDWGQSCNDSSGCNQSCVQIASPERLIPHGPRGTRGGTETALG